MDSLGSFTGTCVSWSAPASGPSLSGTSATTCTDTSGTAVIHPEANLYADVGGTYTVTSTLVGTDSNTTFTCQNLPEPPALIAIVGLTTASSTVNVAYPQIAVQVKDRFNGTISGTAVTLTSPGNGPSFTDTTLHATTNSSGIAIFTPTANTLANPRGTTFTVTATPDLAPSVSTTLPCHNDPGTAYQFAQHYTNDGDNQIVAVSSTYPLPLAVVVQDQYTNPVYSGTPVLFTVLSAPSGASAAFSGGANRYTFNTNDLGTVTTTLLRANTTKGSFWATASSTGIGSFTLNSVNDTESSTWGVAAVTGHPESQSTLVNTSFQDLWVRVVDRWGNTVTSSQAQVVFTVNPSGGATLVQGTQTANSNSSGYASVPATANTVVGSYTVTASVYGSTGSTTLFTLQNLVDPTPATFSRIAGSLQSAKVRTDFPSLLELYVYDAYGNPIPGASVTFVTPTDGATATVATTVVADDSGIVHAQATASSTPGSYLVYATNATVTEPVSFELTNLLDDPGAITIVSGNNQSSTVGTLYGQPLAVRVTNSSSQVQGSCSGDGQRDRRPLHGPCKYAGRSLPSYLCSDQQRLANLHGARHLAARWCFCTGLWSLGEPS